MRISDWSSDVCSSDLVGLPAAKDGKLALELADRGGDQGYTPGERGVGGGEAGGEIVRAVDDHVGARDQRGGVGGIEAPAALDHGHVGVEPRDRGGGGGGLGEIGRASCRERVCQYV